MPPRTKQGRGIKNKKIDASTIATNAKKRTMNNNHPLQNAVYLLQLKKQCPGGSSNARPRILTYIGCTNNFPHRLRQHNGEICNGAKSTTRRLQAARGQTPNKNKNKNNRCGIKTLTELRAEVVTAKNDRESNENRQNYPQNNPCDENGTPMWEPICVVYGFPLRNHALGFEKRVKHILLSCDAAAATIQTARRTEANQPVHERVRKMLMMCNLERWTKKCPLASENPLFFVWYDAAHKPHHNSLHPPYLPMHVHELYSQRLLLSTLLPKTCSNIIPCLPTDLFFLVVAYLSIW
jgi:hypothetical protein